MKASKVKNDVSSITPQKGVSSLGGRPTKYEGAATIEKVKAYLASCVDTQTAVKLSNRTEIVSKNVNLPSVEGLAVFLHVNRDTLYQWQKDYVEFSDIFGEVLAEQAKRLISKGISGEYNSTIVKLLLSKHGYVEKQESKTEVSGNISLAELFKQSKK